MNMPFDLRKAINAISDMVRNRPQPLREFDQIYMKVADMAIQPEYVARVFDGKEVFGWFPNKKARRLESTSFVRKLGSDTGGEGAIRTFEPALEVNLKTLSRRAT
jgi:hypothetical protein